MKKILFSSTSFVRACLMALIALSFVLMSPSAAAALKSSQDVQLREKLAHALQDQLPLTVVDVHVANGVAILTGTVGRLSDRILAEEIAHSIPGISAVRDQLDLIALPVSDHELSQQLSERLHYSRSEAGFTFPNVRLMVKNGIVTATGDVNDYLEHAMVRSMIASEDGVRGLDDQLHVASNYDPDEDTRIAVAKALAGELVQAKVELGVVHLMGSVPSQEKAAELAHKVRTISGVIGVDSELAVKPSPVADLNLTSFINDDVHR